MPNEEYYQQKIVACNKDIRRVQNKLNGMAFLRLLIFIVFCLLVYRILNQYSPLLLVCLFASFAAFIICINIFYRWKDDRRLLEKLLFVNTNEAGLLAGKPNQFPDGASFLSSDNYLDDLDIFGRGSLFHGLNRTTTVKGRNALAQRLRDPLADTDTIRREQLAVRILAEQTHPRQLITAQGLLNEDREKDIDPDNMREWFQTPPILYRHTFRQVAVWLLIAGNLLSIYLWIASGNYTFALAGAIVSRIILAATGKYVARQHQQIDHKKSLFDQYAGILAAFNGIDPADSPLLAGLRDQTASARNAFRRLAEIANFFDYRTNGLVNLWLNTFLLFDLHAVIRLERWKASFHSSVPGWLDAIAAIERLNSLATFAYNHPGYSYPSPVDPTPAATNLAGNPGSTPTLFIEAKALAHPLIPTARRIANDCIIGRDERLILVTGSNMSGKTTFLRTIGVNLLMAQSGLPVCAASFRFTPLQLLTSLRIDDSLLEQTSYFMAELKKLQRIVHRLRTGASALVLIDEILRGTNSEDKTFGSEQFIRQLLQHNCLALFATHDLSLGALEQPGAVSNYCFESTIANGELHFNYQLQRGIATNRNASFLMKKMDII